MKPVYYIYNLKSLIKNEKFVGWGRKKTGNFAVNLSKIFNMPYVLLEDGFIRSIGLGNDESFSIVKDDIGIYYDATAPSRLEKILKEEDLSKDLGTAKEAIELIKAKKISKYNNGLLELPAYLKTDEKRVLIVAQTKGDLSLKYGYATEKNAQEMVTRAIEDNPGARVYLKVHPDVLAGKKESNIDVEFARKHCEVIEENIHPIVLLEAFDKVYTQTSQMGFEALLLGKEVHIFGAPFYMGWGVENLKWHLDEKIKKVILKRRGKKRSVEEIFVGAYIRYSEYYNPFKKQKCDIIETIYTIDRYRNLYMQNEGKLYFFGFSFWKRANTRRFFKPLRENRIFFCKNLQEARKKGLDESAKIYIWGRKEFEEVEKFAKESGVKICRVEDGFIRSVTLGSDLTKAYSLVVDSRGIYFDPTVESDLEWILNNVLFDETILKRAQKIKNCLVESKISKYNIHQDKKLRFDTDKKIVLVVGQVEDDASIVYGGNKMGNLELLKKVYEKRKDEFIIYKPHPDVLAGNRKGNISKKEALKYVNEVIEDVSLPSLLEVCDEVHTITSLSGFEALIRGKEVYTYGMPFYAGWGLTVDEKRCKRRKRKLSINELIAGAYILYPRYISPKTGSFCEPEVVIDELAELKSKYSNNTHYRYVLNFRNFLFRKIQLLGKVLVE